MTISQTSDHFSKTKLESFIEENPEYVYRWNVFIRQPECQHCKLAISSVEPNEHNMPYPCGWRELPNGDIQQIWFSIDHIIPRAKGGTSDPANLQTLCEECNIAKADSLETEMYSDVPANFASEINKKFSNKKLETYYPEWKPWYGL